MSIEEQDSVKAKSCSLHAFLGHVVESICLWKSVEYLNPSVGDCVVKFLELVAEDIFNVR